MGLMDHFLPKWNHSDANVRKAAVEKVTDQTVIADTALLADIAKNDSDERVRRKAVETLCDHASLADVSAKKEAERRVQKEEEGAQVSIEDLIRILESGEASLAVRAGSELAVRANVESDGVIVPLLTTLGDAGMLARYRMLKSSGAWRNDPDAGLLVLELTNRVITQRGLH